LFLIPFKHEGHKVPQLLVTFAELKSYFMETKTAIVVGASGLVGRALIEELCESDSYNLIKVIARAKTGLAGKEKIEEFIIDFDDLNQYSELLAGNDLFICIGTTIKKAGTVSRMEEIDRDLPLNIASAALKNSVEKLAVISSIGADPGSSNYYLRIKGEMERGLMNLKFRTLIILRPSMLMGRRAERRIGEETGKIMLMIFGIFLIGRLSKYKGIEDRSVAKAMVKAINDKTETVILESDEIKKIATNS
jgi:uncharacterized protein YbjT (DUF2867 family)